MMSRRRRLLFYCQHSLGMGHLVRARAIADALSREFDLVLVSGGADGGHASPGARYQTVQLPSLRMDASHQLATDAHDIGLDVVKHRRREVLLELARSWQPECILIELFPFGRKKFEFELLPLLEQARRSGNQHPQVLCSVRDILVRGRDDQQAHDDRACRLLNEWFDAVLVHADPAMVRLEDTFKPSQALQVPLLYTGFVMPERGGNAGVRRQRRVVVSAGGGAVGGPLYRAAIAAQRMLAPDERQPMVIVAGPLLPESQWQDLQRDGADLHDLILHRSVPDLAPLLATSEYAVCQSGYNTSLEVIGSGVRALMVPFSAPGEDEQISRARQLERLGAVRVLEPATLSAASMAAAMRSLRWFEPRAMAIDLAGASRTVELILKRLAAVAPPQSVLLANVAQGRPA
jgi:predicted glycosyltransferase